MDNSLYEEYMRNVLGYQPMNNYNNISNTMPTSNYQNLYENTMISDNQNISAMDNMQMQELEDCYPDIYRIVYPMVQKACDQNTKAINKELVDCMTEEIYLALEDNNRSTGLNNLIRILLIRELLGRPNFPWNRPPRPPRPPMPPRPPIRPRINPYIDYSMQQPRLDMEK